MPVNNSQDYEVLITPEANYPSFEAQGYVCLTSEGLGGEQKKALGTGIYVKFDLREPVLKNMIICHDEAEMTQRISDRDHPIEVDQVFFVQEQDQYYITRKKDDGELYGQAIEEIVLAQNYGLRKFFVKRQDAHPGDDIAEATCSDYMRRVTPPSLIANCIEIRPDLDLVNPTAEKTPFLASEIQIGVKLKDLFKHTGKTKDFYTDSNKKRFFETLELTSQEKIDLSKILAAQLLIGNLDVQTQNFLIENTSDPENRKDRKILGIDFGWGLSDILQSGYAKGLDINGSKFALRFKPADVHSRFFDTLIRPSPTNHNNDYLVLQNTPEYAIAVRAVSEQGLIDIQNNLDDGLFSEALENIRDVYRMPSELHHRESMTNFLLSNIAPGTQNQLAELLGFRNFTQVIQGKSQKELNFLYQLSGLLIFSAHLGLTVSQIRSELDIQDSVNNIELFSKTFEHWINQKLSSKIAMNNFSMALLALSDKALPESERKQQLEALERNWDRLKNTTFYKQNCSTVELFDLIPKVSVEGSKQLDPILVQKCFTPTQLIFKKLNPQARIRSQNSSRLKDWTIALGLDKNIVEKIAYSAPFSLTEKLKSWLIPTFVSETVAYYFKGTHNPCFSLEYTPRKIRASEVTSVSIVPEAPDDIFEKLVNLSLEKLKQPIVISYSLSEPDKLEKMLRIIRSKDPQKKVTIEVDDQVKAICARIINNPDYEVFFEPDKHHEEINFRTKG